MLPLPLPLALFFPPFILVEFVLLTNGESAAYDCTGNVNSPTYPKDSKYVDLGPNCG